MHQLKENVFYTGAIDWDIRNFHGYSTPFGTTYNSYLIIDEKPTVIDTVKKYCADEMLSRIKESIDPSEIKYIISNHTEMDHSGAIDELLEYCPDAEIVCSPKGAEELKRHFKKNWKFKIVKTGDMLNIGKRDLLFHQVPMVHWPDSMVTYSSYDKILFSNDAFGLHYASSYIFADEVGLDMIYKEAAKYYANIVLPYGNQVIKALDALGGLDFDMICNSHGMLFRGKEQISKMIKLYNKWARNETDNKVVIVYYSMWGSTEKMAKKLFRQIDAAGINVKLHNLKITHISDILADVLESKILILGSPVLNSRILPDIAALLMYMKGLKPKGRTALTFGSYGWARIAYKELEASLQEAGFNLPADGAYLQFVPDDKELDELISFVPEIQKVFEQ